MPDAGAYPALQEQIPVDVANVELLGHEDAHASGFADT